MKLFKSDPINIIPKEYKHNNYTIVKYSVPDKCDSPSQIIVEVKFSYGGTTSKKYLDVLKEYLNST